MKKELLSLLAPFGQEHLLAFWETLDERARRVLGDQIRAVDFERIRSFYENRDAPAGALALADRASDPPGYKFSTVPPGGPACRAEKPITAAEAIEAGEDDLRNGRVAVVLVAGGQGTRLGFAHPKGLYPIGPVSNVTLFQIHVEKVRATARRYGRSVPLCVMTSTATHEETVRFFEDHDRFGLPESDLYVFQQGNLPAVDAASGKLLLAEPGSLALSPDGHGGMLPALARDSSRSAGNSVLSRLENRGIESLFYFQVDNPLVRVASPEYIGYRRLADAEMTCQVIRKRSPNDRVGNVVDIDGRLHIIEYSDLPDAVAQRTKPDGSLAIWAGSIAVHMFDLAFLRRMSAATGGGLPVHIARKKVAHLDTENGAKIEPTVPNAIKFERFIFDLLPSARNAVVVEIDVFNHYAPLKNAPGGETDSPETVRRDLVVLHASWLEQAGLRVAPGTPVEIAPLFALDPGELAEKRHVFSRRDGVIDSPTYFR